jgi:hypothetical protein
VSFILTPMLKAARPIVWFVNLFVQGLLRTFRFQPNTDAATTLTQEELRSLVLEGSQYFRGKHKTMLANLMDLEAITVDDVMTPRNRIHTLDLAEKPALLRQQLATSYHSRLPVHEGSLENLVGVLPLKAVVALVLGSGEITAGEAAAAVAPALLHSRRNAAPDAAHPVPERPPAARARGRRIRRAPGPRDHRGHRRGDHRRVHHAGPRRAGDLPARARRQRNRFRHGAPAHAQSPARHPVSVDGPKTLNGLILEHLGDIPEAAPPSAWRDKCWKSCKPRIGR